MGVVSDFEFQVSSWDGTYQPRINADKKKISHEKAQKAQKEISRLGLFCASYAFLWLSR